MQHKQGGFTIIELLVTLFVAAIFLIAGYQLYTSIIRADGQTRAQSAAQSLAADYEARYIASAPYPCVASTPLTNSPVSASGLSNVTISVTITCPKSAPNNIASVAVLVKYGTPQIQISYSNWAYVQDVCGQGWILVPGDSRFGTPNFCVMKYEAKNVNGQALSQAAGAPWVSINQNDAAVAAAAACPTCHLMSEAEWMTLAANTLSVSSNWSGGAVGSGSMYIGHTDNSPANTLAASNDDTNGYYGTGNTASSGANQRRTLTLNNGEVIWDMSGDVWEWTNATIGASQSPGLSGDTGTSNKEWTNSTLLWNGLPTISQPSSISSQVASWNSTQGVGQLCSNYGATSTMAYLRGASFMDNVTPPTAGVLSLYVCLPPTTALTNVGFRVAKSIDSQPEQLPAPSSCPTGFIPVPGDARFGTVGFCVMKYDAKNDGSGNAVSVAAGTPWVNIAQAGAISKSAAACAGCHLMSEAEWMTIASSIISVPSNWSGGAVGSGYIFRGHGDSNPSGPLAASTDDTNGYYGTGNSSASGTDQRRTLTLTNGQVIWDFAGNVWQWTSGDINANAQLGFAGESTAAWKQWNDPNLLMNGFPTIGRPGTISAQVGSWSTAQGIGMLQSNYGSSAVDGLMRGGSYGGGTYDGVLTLSSGNLPTVTDSSLGFRVAK